MAVKETTIAAQNVLLEKHQDLFWVIAHACGGVVLQNQFNTWISNTNKGTTKAVQITKKFIDAGLIKKQKFFRNNLLILCKPALRSYGRDSTAHIGTRKILHSAMIMQILIIQGFHDPTATRKYLESTTIPHYALPSGYALLCALEQYSQQIEAQCPEWNREGLQVEKQRMAKRVLFQKEAQQLGRGKLELDTSQKDLFALELLSIYINQIKFTINEDITTLHIYTSYFNLSGKYSKFIVDNIMTAIDTLESVFFSLHLKHEIQIHMTIYSHDKENPHQQQSILREANQRMEQQHRFQNMKEILKFVWLDSSDRLFSHIPVKQLI